MGMLLGMLSLAFLFNFLFLCKVGLAPCRFDYQLKLVGISALQLQNHDGKLCLQIVLILSKLGFICSLVYG